YDKLIEAGSKWQESIVDSIAHAHVIVVLFSQNANDSPEIQKELAVANRCDKPVLPIRLADVTPSGTLLYELAWRNWANAFPEQEKRITEIVDSLAKRFANRGPVAPAVPLSENAREQFATGAPALKGLIIPGVGKCALTYIIVTCILAGLTFG